VIVHNEETLQQALTLTEQGPVRYRDTYMYTMYSNPDVLEVVSHKALERGDIAIVVPVGQERIMEVHHHELRRVKERRRRQELKDVRNWISEHPEVKGLTSEAEIVRVYRKSRKEGA